MLNLPQWYSFMGLWNELLSSGSKTEHDEKGW